MSAPVLLSQQDFESGTLRITQPGTYLLTENIVFNPIPLAQRTDLVEVLKAQMLVDITDAVRRSSFHDPTAYGLGFAAIAIECDDVIIDLNGFTLEQGLEHSLHQRFFGLITLNDQPFHHYLDQQISVPSLNLHASRFAMALSVARPITEFLATTIRRSH